MLQLLNQELVAVYISGVILVCRVCVSNINLAFRRVMIITVKTAHQPYVGSVATWQLDNSEYFLLLNCYKM